MNVALNKMIDFKDFSIVLKFLQKVVIFANSLD